MKNVIIGILTIGLVVTILEWRSTVIQLNLSRDSNEKWEQLNNGTIKYLQSKDPVFNTNLVVTNNQ